MLIRILGLKSTLKASKEELFLFLSRMFHVNPISNNKVEFVWLTLIGYELKRDGIRMAT